MTPLKVGPEHWIEGVELAGGAAMGNRVYAVCHFTGGWNAGSSIDYWRTPAAKGALAHFVIDRDGHIIQCRPTNKTAGHAGESRWKDRVNGKVWTGLNACSIGIEFCNTGDLGRTTLPATADTSLLKLAGTKIPLIAAKHKNGGKTVLWEIYPNAQIEAGIALLKALKERYNLDGVLGHDDIAPDRKNDPGPAFPWMRIVAAFPGWPVSNLTP